MASVLRPGVERRLRAGLAGEARFDAFTRGRYATDASIYQVMPLGVVLPQTLDDVRHTIRVAREEGVPVLARGGGSSQCGQTVNEAIVVDTSRHLKGLVELDAANRRCVVEPGIVLDELNRLLKPHGLWFPVDVSTASRATIGGMAANNSCGTRSIRYGIMRDNVHAIDAILADGSEARFAPDSTVTPELVRDLAALGAREADEIARRFPKLMRRVGGYNIDALVPNALVPGGRGPNLAELLVGSEGTLAYFSRIELKLAPLLGQKSVGVAHFPTFAAAMGAAQHIVTLKPTAVELIDRTMIELARDIAMFRPTVERFVRGEPAALLVVEFAEDDAAENAARLKQLGEMMGDLGFAWNNPPGGRGGVVEAPDPELQAAIADVRSAGLNIMMSMKDEAKPVSFVEDCAVELKDLAAYTAGLTEIFERHGTRGTWYAHASVGCLHVRPVLNLKLDLDVKKMRAIAEEAFALVRAYKGSHSGEHGDGIVRSEFHAAMFGERIVEAFKQVKQRFDPNGLFNPGRIVDAPRMDDRRLLRYGPEYGVADFATAFDWSAYPGAAGGFQGAVEMCNNNGACRKLSGAVMCPSYRVTLNERDVTRGRANTLRLAISGQLGPGALASDEMAETMKLCVACKACRRECPTGVDMAKMKTEAAAARIREHGLSLRDRLIAWLPRYAPLAARAPWLMNLRDRVPGAAELSQSLLGFTARRALPRWRSDVFRWEGANAGDGREVVLFADTFNTYFEPENLHAAARVLTAGGLGVVVPGPAEGRRPLCCGRTFLAAGLVEQARDEARRLVAALLPYAERGVAIVGLEPACLLTLRDELPALLPGRESDAIAAQARLLEEFLAEAEVDLPLDQVNGTVLLHGHCHQKAFGAMAATEAVLARIPGLKVETVQSSCCGMAGAFGYGADTYEVSMQMAELSLLPAVRRADPQALVVADGTSCRQQILDGSGRQAMHAAKVLDAALRSVVS